ncbi:MAG: hypothetical protein JXX29_07780 [Deltaproteobacteria bacterium]|nr:hypothetical protein [Deltaproteobacteria bacterium]MBN2671557.1 hypothetical protein [Deltaproteobacteria bacterium]
MKKNVLFYCFFILAVVGCSPEQKASKQTQVKPVAATPDKQNDKVDVLKQLPPLNVTEDVDGLKKMQALRSNSAAMRFRAQGEHQKSIETLISALKLHPGNQNIRYNLAVELLLSGKQKDAIAVLRQFQDAPSCKDCFVMLAKAQDDPMWEPLKQNSEFTQLVTRPAKQLEAALAASRWISLDEAALEKKELQFSFPGLPAISKDGSRIVGARIEYNRDQQPVAVTMHTLDVASGDRIHGQRIWFESESVRFYSGKLRVRDVTTMVENRIRYFNISMLSKEWDRIPAVDMVKDQSANKQCETPQILEAAGKHIAYTFPSLTILNADKSAAFTGSVDQWGKSDNKICSTHARIRQVYFHAATNTFLFDLSYCSPQCSAPSGKWAAVHLIHPPAE